MRSPSSRTALVALTALFSSSKALELDVSSQDAIRAAAASAAHGLMSYYTNNQSTTAEADIGTFPSPIYWWEAGAIWGGMVDYYAYTGDASYVQATSDALMAQIGPNADYIVPSHKGDEGNDDQEMWALSVMSAAEEGFPQPDGKPLWGQIASNAFNNILTRWNTDSCGGGFKWQIYPENSYGYNYRNSISNGGFFQLAARLGRYTSNSTYVEWAEKVWDWTVSVGYISIDYKVYDGADDRQNCTIIDHNTWSYNNAVFLYGCAAMYAQTGDAKWLDRTNGLLKAAADFFTAYDNSTNVMSEIVCEGTNKCNTDQASFKAYLARWMAKTSVLAPSTKGTIMTYLEASAKAAMASCSGATCGMKWFVGGYDGNTGVGQQLSAMEVVQALLVSNAGTPGTSGNVNSPSSSAAAPSSSSTPAAVSTPVVSAPAVISTPAGGASLTAALSTPAALTTPAPAISASPVSPAPSSHVPGLFPELPASSSYCTVEIATVTVTVPKSTPTPSPLESACTMEIVTVTATVAPSPSPIVPSPSSILAIGSSSTPAAVSSVTPSPLYPSTLSSIAGTGTPITFSSGFLASPTYSAPAIFTGAASSKKTQGSLLVGAMGAVMGVAAFL